MAKLTKEQKQAKKEAKKLEKLRVAEELRCQIKRNELNRELALQKRTIKLLDGKWKEMMLSVKLPIFRQDVEVMWRSFERACDKKDALIHHLMRLMDEANSQYDRTIGSFCEIIQAMITKYQSDVESLSTAHEENVRLTLAAGESDAAALADARTRDERHLNLVMFELNTVADNYLWKNKGENMVKLDEEALRMSNERESMRSRLEQVYGALWETLRAELRAYTARTRGTLRATRDLRARDQRVTEIIARQAERARTSQELIGKLRMELTLYDTGEVQAASRAEFARYRAAHARARDALLAGRALDASRIDQLAYCSGKAIEWLARNHSAGEGLLRAVQLCRKLETLQEKVLPFGTRAPRSQPHSPKRPAGQDGSVPSFVQTADTYVPLERFWQRVARATIVHKTLLAERTILIRENEQLREHIQMLKQEQDNAIDRKAAGGPRKAPVAVEASAIYKRLL